MTERTMSPSAAQAHARVVIRQRMKAYRKDSRPVREIKVDSPHVLAGRLVALLKDAAAEEPGEWSPAFTEHVINRFSDRYVELSRVAPIPMKAGAR